MMTYICLLSVNFIAEEGSVFRRLEEGQRTTVWALGAEGWRIFMRRGHSQHETDNDPSSIYVYLMEAA